MTFAPSECLRLALQALHDAALAHGADAASSSISQKLAHLSACVQDLLKRQKDLERSLEDRSIAERALRNVLANKEAESARLHSEISRLRHSLQAGQTTETSDSALQDKQIPSPADECAAVLDAAGRKALLEAAIAAKQKPVAVLLQLESKVSACKDRISILECELAAAAAEHASRLSEQQKGFLSKLEQLRHVHSQQLATATADAVKAAKEQHQQQQQVHHEKQVAQLQAQSRQQHEQQQALIESLQQRLQQLQHQHHAASTQHSGEVLADSQGTGTAAIAINNCVLGANAHSLDTQASSMADSRNSTAAAAASHRVAEAEGSKEAAAEAAALQLMEGQLIRLSGTIKAHQEEVRQLREALLAGAEERRQLQQRVQQLTDQQQQQQQHTPPSAAVAAAQPCASAAVGRSKKPTGTGTATKAMLPGMVRSGGRKQSEVGR